VAATYSDAADLATNPAFLRKVQVAMVTAAIEVAQEAQEPTPSADYWRLRRALSVNVLTDPVVWAPKFAWAAASNVALTSESTDSDIQFTVNSQWASIAGAGQAPTGP
jgi:hypothetical protein